MGWKEREVDGEGRPRDVTAAASDPIGRDVGDVFCTYSLHTTCSSSVTG